MFKKIVSLLVMTVMSVFLMSGIVSAEEATPYWLYTDMCSSILSVSGTTATCSSTCQGYAGETTRITITQVLQKKDSYGNWYSVSGWVKTVNSYYGSANNTSTGLSKGTYRLKTMFDVYAGTNYETITKYSSSKTIS